MTAPDEVAALYKIDYTTTLAQPGSKLCNIPNEVLCEICKPLFAGFGLQLTLSSFFETRTHPPPKSLTSRTSTADLEILRCCKVLRQRLLPLLIDLTSSVLTVVRTPDGVFYGRGGVDFDDYAGPRIRQIRLAKPFRAKIKHLIMRNRTPGIPDPSCFGNLEEIYLLNEDGMPVTNQSIWDDEAKLLRAYRAIVDDSLTQEERDSSGLAPKYVTAIPRGAEQRWILQFIKKLKAQEENCNIRVILSSMFFDHSVTVASGWHSHSRLGRVFYDVTAGTLTKKPWDDDSSNAGGRDNDNDGDNRNND